MDAAQRADAGPPAGRTGMSTAQAVTEREDSRPGPPERAVPARPASKLPRRRLLGRRTECEVLERLVASVREGHSQALVLRGEAGVGKTALLDYVAESARGCHVVRAAGVEPEMELPFAGLHQLCAPFLDRLENLPGPQRGALGAAFGLRDGDSPDRFLVSMAVLSLLSVVAETRPLLWAVDDVQWLDRASVQALAFAARRLAAEPVGLIFAARGPDAGLTGLTELMVEGLPEGDARKLLDSVLTGPLDERVRDQIVAETRGNPLALVELVRGLMPVELAGGFGLPGSVPLSGRIEESFRRRLSALPAPTQRLVQLAAADPTGDPLLVWRAGERLGTTAEAAMPAAEAGLVEFGARVVFRHPLVRSAAYQSASFAERRAAHRALAETTDPGSDPDRRAWHRAQATAGPDEDLAAELEMSAARAQARGGLAAAAAFLERAATLTAEPARRVERLLAAARAKRDAGALDMALGLLTVAEAGPRDALQTAEVEHLRGQIAMDQRRGRDGARLLLSAARQLAPLSADLARETHLEALAAAIWADDLGSPGKIREAAEAARTAPRSPRPPRLADVLLDAFALRLTEGFTAAAPALTRALELVLALNLTDEVSSWLWLAGSRASGVITLELWDDAAAYSLATRLVQFARGAGALTQLQFALSYRARTLLLSGELLPQR
jgi:AAA ATPase-like protein